ncbi:MAG: GNAT family N-acetyltransferase [Pleurocapsa sp. SU_196_0]|nr:GNAT family N-acetyltransferase [Pleurocapsa sp. SU_196_0]
MTTRSDLECLELQIETLYVCDAGGALKFIREPGYDESELDPAPRFFMGRTAEGNRFRFRDDVPDDLRLELDALCRLEPISANLEEEPRQTARIRDALRLHAPITDEYRGPAFRLPEPFSRSRDAVLVTAENAAVLEKHFPWKLTSSNSFRTAPMTATVVDGSAVSICFCARLSNTAAEAGLETTPGERGHGYAVPAVALWAAAIRAQNLEPLYSTAWDNFASRAVARKLGAVMYAEDWSIA